MNLKQNRLNLLTGDFHLSDETKEALSKLTAAELKLLLTELQNERQRIIDVVRNDWTQSNYDNLIGRKR